MQTTLPYSENYIVRIGGRKVKTHETLGALLAFDVPAGNYTIEVEYLPKDFYLGLGISILSFFIYMFFLQKKKKA